MGIRLATTTTAARATAGTTLSFSHDGGSGSDRLLVVAVAGRSTSATVSALTYNGVALTSAGAISGSTLRLEVWRLIAPATGTNTVAVTVGASAALAAWARTFEDVHQTTPLGTATTASGTSATPTVTPAANDPDLTIDALAYGGSAPTPDAPGPAQGEPVAVESVLGGTLSSDVGLAGSTQPGGAASDAMSWALSASAAWAVVGVAVKATGTGTTLARVSQVATDVLVLPTAPAARVSQVAVDVLLTGYSTAAPGAARTQVVTAG